MPISADEQPDSETFPMRVAARLTGVTPERMRAWESRYGAVEPQRSEGGSRRYTHADLDRLRLLRRVVEAGHRIRDVARLDREELESRLAAEPNSQAMDFEPVIRAVATLDASEARRLLTAELAERGEIDFARDYALALAWEIGACWERGELSVAAEHLATAILRSMLIEALGRGRDDVLGPQIVFATCSGERHDLGLLVAALVAKQVSARPVFVGADVPEDELVASIGSRRAEALVLGFVTLPAERVVEVLRSLRRAIPRDIEIWVGGSGIEGCSPVPGVDRILNFEQLAAHVLRLTRSADAAAQRGETAVVRTSTP